MRLVVRARPRGPDGARAPSVDRLDGGDGEDFVSYHARRSPVSVDLADSRPDGASGEYDVLTAIESIVGGRGRDRLAGDHGPNTINGGGGRDRLFGRDGDDELAFRTGSISCGRGADVVSDDTNTRHGRLGEPRADNEFGYVQPDCETVRPKGDHPWLPAYPARLRPAWVGYRVSCRRDTYDNVVACSGVVRLTEASGRRRLLGSRAFPRGP